MKTENISWHIYGAHPTREADAEDRKLPGFIVAFPRGFKCLEVAVYSVDNESDATEAAVEWISKHHPQALSDAEREGDNDADAYRLDPYRDMTSEDEERLCREIAAERGVEWLLSVGDVYSIIREELNNEILERWENR